MPATSWLIRITAYPDLLSFSNSLSNCWILPIISYYLLRSNEVLLWGVCTGIVILDVGVMPSLRITWSRFFEEKGFVDLSCKCDLLSMVVLLCWAEELLLLSEHELDFALRMELLSTMTSPSRMITLDMLPFLLLLLVLPCGRSSKAAYLSTVLKAFSIFLTWWLTWLYCFMILCIFETCFCIHWSITLTLSLCICAFESIFLLRVTISSASSFPTSRMSLIISFLNSHTWS